jgi:hypothetical protein
LESALVNNTGYHLKPISTVAVVVFFLVALAHLVRVVLGWDVSVNGVSIPIWVSVVACAVTAVLAFMLWRESRS